MLTTIAIAPINHVIQGESWACRRLQNYAGIIVRIYVLPLIDFTFMIQNDGKITTMPNGTTTDVSISLSASTLPFLLSSNSDAVYNNIKTSGNDAVAKELINIGKHLHWDIAQDLSKIIGDIPANRIVHAGNTLLEWHTKNIQNFSETLAEYYLEEQPVLTKKLTINHFVAEVDQLLKDTNRLEQRTNNLASHMPR